MKSSWAVMALVLSTAVPSVAAAQDAGVAMAAEPEQLVVPLADGGTMTLTPEVDR